MSAVTSTGRPNVRYLVCETKSLYAPFATRTSRYTTFVGDDPVWVHDHTSTAEGRLTDLVNRLDRHQVLGMADDSDAKMMEPSACGIPRPDCRALTLQV